MLDVKNNIMGFTKQANHLGWNKKIWYLFMLSIVVIYCVLGIIKFVSSKTQYVNLLPIKGVFSWKLLQPENQYIATTIVNSFKNHAPVKSDLLLDLYQNRYDKNCVTIDQPLGCKFYPYHKEVISYLGYYEPKTYLILLQNSAEVRPNGGFYGSFIRVTFSGGLIQDMKVHDSYEVPFVNSGVYLNLPEWTTNYLGHNKASFIAGNKFGFTDRDGLIIRSIYNKTYHTNIDGVVFMSTKTLVSLIPSLQDKLWTWQFMNASVDLIRGTSTGNKKQLYMSEMTNYLKNNKIGLVAQGISHYEKLFQSGMMQVYLPDASVGLKSLMQKLGWITSIESNHLYLWDINQSYSKVDGFVKKHTQIINTSGIVVFETDDNIIDTSGLSSGAYEASVMYHVSIPGRYDRLIKKLQEKYAITLTQREHHILGLDKHFEYKSVIFAGSGLGLHTIKGQIDDDLIFDAGGSQAVAYHLVSMTGDTRSFSLSFTKY